MITDSMYYFLKSIESSPLPDASLTQTQIDLRDAALSGGYISMGLNERNELCYTLNPTAKLEILTFEDILNKTAEDKREKAIEKHSDRRFEVFLALLSFALGMIAENRAGIISSILDAIHSITP